MTPKSFRVYTLRLLEVARKNSVPAWISHKLDAWDSALIRLPLRSARALGKPEEVAVFVEYLIPRGFTMPPEFNLNNFTGLLSSEVVRTGCEHDRLITCWRNQELSNTHSPSFEKALSLTSAAWNGRVAQSYWRSLGWWQPASWSDLITKAGAVVAAIGIVWIAGLWVFAGADVAVPSRPVQNVFEREPLKIELTLINNSRTATDMRISEAVLRPVSSGESTKHVLDISPDSHTDVKSGEARQIDLTTDAPTPGRYQFHAKVTAKSGALRRPWYSEGPYGDVEVWSRVPEMRLDVGRTEVIGNVCKIAGTLRVGSALPNGVQCDISSRLYGDIRFRGVNAERGFQEDWEDPEYNLTPGKETGLLRWWLLGPLREFTQIDIEILMFSSTSELVSDCTKIAAAVQCACEPGDRAKRRR